MEKIKTPLVCWFLLLAMILANGMVLKMWTVKDTRPLSWDESIHTLNALDFKDRLREHNFSSLLKKPAIFCYPPLYHFILATTIGATSDIADTGAFVNFFFLALLMGVTFLLARELLDPYAALAAAFLVSCYPLIIDISRAPMIDLALTAWVALLLLFLHKSDHFQSFVWTVAFGVALGLGQWFKWTAWIYVLGALGLEFVLAFRNKTLRRGFLALGIAFVVAAPWYLSNIISVLSMFSRMSVLPPSGIVLHPWLTWLWYPLAFPQLVGGLFFLLFLPAVLICWLPKYFSLTLGIIVSVISMFFLSDNYNARYIMPIVPSMAILSVAWLPSARKIPILGVLLVATFYFSMVHFYSGAPISLSIGKISIPILVSDSPQVVDWKHKAILQRIEQLSAKDSVLGRVVVLSNHPYFHSSSLEVSRQAMGINNFIFQGPNKDRWLDFTQFVLSKTGDLGPDFSLGNIKPAVEMVNHPPDWFKSSYREVGRWSLPDDSEAVLYQASPVPLKQAGAGILNLSLREFNMRKVRIENFKLRAESLSSAESALGKLKTLTLECSKLHYQEMTFEDLSFKFVKPQVNLPRFLETGEIQFISMEALQPKAKISSQLLIENASRKARWLKDPVINFSGESILLSGRAYGLPLQIELILHLSDKALVTHLEKIHVGGLPLPRFLFSGVTDRTISLAPSSDLPFHLELGTIKTEHELLILGGQ